MTTEIENNNVSAPNIIEAFFKAYKNYFNFKDRTSRYDFWGFLITYFLASLILGIIVAFLPPINILGTIFSFATIIPFIAIIVRRLHDRNKSALTWIIAPFVVLFFLAAMSTMISTIYTYKTGIETNKSFLISSFFIIFIPLYYFALLIMCAFKGQAESNRFGAPVTETPRQVKVGKWLAIFYFVIPLFFGIISVGGIAGYSNAIIKYKTNKTLDQATMIISNINTLYEKQDSFNGLNNQTAIQMQVVPEDMLSVNPGQLVSADNTDVQISGFGHTFIVRYDSMSSGICDNIKETPLEGYGTSTKVEELPDGKSCTITFTTIR